HQIISLMTFDGTDNTLSLPDHADHIHVGFRPATTGVATRGEWARLMRRLARLDNPALPIAP
ncbi:MAG TPA: hypothetical protein VNT03_08510, partial [Baekduia sp.]|nr:hypothetical protein [Baekduia sp.]